MNASYRLKHIYIPEEFIEGTWYNLHTLTMKYGSGGKHTVTMSLENLKTGGTYAKYMTKDAAKNRYVFDVNQFLIDHIEELETYTVSNQDAGDLYVKEFVHSFTMDLRAVSPKDDGLDGGEYLSATKANLPAYTYDGVYVDRTKEDMKEDEWTLKSRPTVLYSAGYDYWDDTWYRNYLEVSFTSSDVNAENYQGDLSGTTTEDYYQIKNLVGNMQVGMSRTTALSDTLSSFAYDVDLDADGNNQKLGVDEAHLLPNDYIEYHLTIGAADDSALPIYRPELRFTVPDGQRIIGWKIGSRSDKLDIKDEDITATAIAKGETQPVVMNRDKLYAL